MRVEATLNNLRIAPRKVRLVAHSIVGLSVAAALVALQRQVKRSSQPMTTLLRSAVANATNNFQLAEEKLFVKEVRVLDGPRLKRYMPKAFGQATPILRRSATIKIILDERTPATKTVPAKKTKMATKQPAAVDTAGKHPKKSSISAKNAPTAA
jgi:large subunit ribosomal protein L22